jgi:hypothetical protein
MSQRFLGYSPAAGDRYSGGGRKALRGKTSHHESVFYPGRSNEPREEGEPPAGSHRSVDTTLTGDDRESPVFRAQAESVPCLGPSTSKFATLPLDPALRAVSPPEFVGGSGSLHAARTPFTHAKRRSRNRATGSA